MYGRASDVVETIVAMTRARCRAIWCVYVPPTSGRRQGPVAAGSCDLASLVGPSRGGACQTRTRFVPAGSRGGAYGEIDPSAPS